MTCAHPPNRILAITPQKPIKRSFPHFYNSASVGLERGIRAGARGMDSTSHGTWCAQDVDASHGHGMPETFTRSNLVQTLPNNMHYQWKDPDSEDPFTRYPFLTKPVFGSRQGSPPPTQSGRMQVLPPRLFFAAVLGPRWCTRKRQRHIMKADARKIEPSEAESRPKRNSHTKWLRGLLPFAAPWRRSRALPASRQLHKLVYRRKRYRNV